MTMTLSFEEFRKPRAGVSVPRYNNFFLYFIDAEKTIASCYRKEKHFLRFKEAYPKKEKFLTDVITFWRMNQKEDPLSFLPLYEEELYEAYIIMGQYVDSDHDLFG